MNTKNTQSSKGASKTSTSTKTSIKTSTKTSTAKGSNRTRWIAGGIAALVVVAALVAIVASSGGDDSAGDSGAAAPTTDASGGTVTTAPIEQIRPVTITGDPLVPFESVENDPAVGTAAPRVDGESFNGTPVSIAPGKPTMAVFLAHWCPHCRREVPRLVEWYEQGKVPQGLDVIGVATGTSKDAPNYPPSDWLANEDWPWPVLVDDENSTAMSAFGLSSFPGFVLINPDGTVALRVTGEVETDQLTQLVNQYLGL